MHGEAMPGYPTVDRTHENPAAAAQFQEAVDLDKTGMIVLEWRTLWVAIHLPGLPILPTSGTIG